MNAPTRRSFPAAAESRAFLYSEMENDMVQQMLRRLAVVKPPAN
ncbi:MAG: hypothetical protein R3E83_00095 [Burkholderiaceae bacterium]